MIRATRRLLFLIACFHQAISTKIEEVKPRWIDSKNNNSKTLPDLIQIDLNLESGKITLNLIKQSIVPNKLPLVISGLEGQKSIWEPSENELLGIYSDYSFDASATVAIMKTDEIKETLYMVTLTHDDETVSLGPNGVFTEDLNLGNDDEYDRNEGTKSRVLSINGVLHSLVERRRMPGQNIHLARAYRMRNSRIRKRSTVKDEEKRLMTIEIFTLIDYSIFKKFTSESKSMFDEGKRNDAIKSIYHFFTHVMEEVRKIYENIESNGLKFTIKWVGAFIAENPDDSSFIEQGKTDILSGKTLRDIKAWVSNQTANQDSKIKFPNYDLLIAFTGIRLIEAHGRAIRNGICTSDNVAVVNYYWYFNMIKTIAHEIGHSLGALHDEHRNDCKNEDGYLMSIFNKHLNLHNSIFFSKCSVSYFNNTIAKMDASNKNCLTNEGDFSEHHETDIFLKLHLGQIYDLDEQCKMEFGSESLYIGGRGNDKVMCRNISCLNADFKLIAMDGTPCSNKSWCLGGECVSDSRAPRVPENCINGDKLYQLNSKNNSASRIECKKNIKDGSEFCQSDQFRNDCCLSCAQNESVHRGCHDTLEECSMLEPHDCYRDYYASVCCKTCRFFVQNQSDTSCLYGDRVAGCLDIVPSVCHISSKLCCKTCASYLSSNKQNGNAGFIPNPNNFSYLCSQGDFPDILEYKTVWGKNRRLKCNQLIDRDPSLCYNSVVQKYCCASCSAVELVKDYCKNGDTTDSLIYFNKKFTCSQLVAYNPRLCETGNIKNLCCGTCGRFTIRPVILE